ncbi:MBOAT family O-acyltransferase [Microbaculum sp. FT89]|uniref:MBOAT family O-acyltransferase n=1 Tax=Microbaculum sp. FT89 TaxID=3447298 RepID=UPI003F534B5D
MTLVFDNLMSAVAFVLAFMLGHLGAHLLRSERLVLANALLFSIAFAFIASIETAITAILMAAYAAIFVRLDSQRWISAGVVPVTAIFIAGRIASDHSDLSLLFLPFIYIRTLGTIVWTWRYPKERFAPRDVFLSLLFFPTLPIGPIQFADRINVAALCTLPTTDDVAHGAKRVLIGIAKVAWFGPEITSQLGSRFAALDDGPFGILFKILALWAGLFNIYIMFSGYVDVAVGLCRFVGIQSRENFNRPWMARTIQEFWQRWHMSLVWVTNNLGYHPYVRRTGHRYLGIVLAFTFIGVWHAFTWNYLLWGFGHGVALAIFAWAQRHPRVRAIWARTQGYPALNLLLQGLGWFATMTYVSALSDFAAGELG